MSTVLILLDAFRWDYLSRDWTPFLFEEHTKGLYVRKVRPGPGFCERSEILTGKPPAVTGNFTAIGYEPQASPYRRLIMSGFMDSCSKLLSVVPRLHRYARYRAGIVIRRSIGKGMPVYWIPFGFLRHFALTEDKYDHCRANAFNVPSVLDQLRDSNESFFCDSFTSLSHPSGLSDSDRLRLALDAAPVRHRLYLVYISEPDSLGHAYGPDSEELKRGLRVMDSQLRMFTEEFRRRDPEACMLFLGDHGMVNIDHVVDVEGRIAATASHAKLKPGRDFIYFLDSTMVRLWYFSEKAKRVITEMFLSSRDLSEFGSIVAQGDAERFGIPLGDRRYGDTLWLAREGVLVSPDFFNGPQRVRAMHGYIPTSDEGCGMLIKTGPALGPSTRESMDLCEVANALLES